MRKLLFLLFISLLLFSCKIVKFYPETYSNALDFKSYTEKGFFITTSPSVNFDYEPIGMVSSSARSGYNKELKENKSKRVYFRANPSDALNELHREAIKRGANGVIDLKIYYETADVKNIWIFPLPFPIVEKGRQITVKGMLIKR
ncbi:hypothetical protein D0T49_06160 [Paludibacter sp. 221]|uniref:hypothetical protein n=1 Tax=Paludibacter sp. 221 TaxID=2302939 RepID=UPI0013D05A44|nr:hypothetical protein [Paludibacter sp. 221]NDV46626.1 hypothetical protein [Paludibacter sp. 221]